MSDSGVGGVSVARQHPREGGSVCLSACICGKPTAAHTWCALMASTRFPVTKACGWTDYLSNTPVST